MKLLHRRAGDYPRMMTVLLVIKKGGSARAWGLKRAFHYSAKTEYSCLYLSCIQPKKGNAGSLMRQELVLKKITLPIKGT